jgi:hypothetical protein
MKNSESENENILNKIRKNIQRNKDIENEYFQTIDESLKERKINNKKSKKFEKKIYYLINEEIERVLVIQERSKRLIYEEKVFGILIKQEEKYNSSDESLEKKAEWDILNRKYRGYKEAFEYKLNEESIIYDSVFGLLKKREEGIIFWSSYKHSNIFDRVLEILIYTDEITETYKNNFLNFLKIENKIKTKVKKAILDYYKTEFEDYYEASKEEENELTPKAISDLEYFIFPNYLTISEEQIEIYFFCTWDSGHEIKVVIIDDRIDYVGSP